MFTLVTIYGTMYLDSQLISYIDKRQFNDDSILTPPGPLGYDVLIAGNAIFIAPTFLFTLNQCLADGFLVCSVPYSAVQMSNVG